MTHIIILFFATFSAAMVGVVFPGLVNITAAKTSTNKGKQSGIIFSAGASLTVVIQAYIGVLISKYLYNNPYVIDILLKIAILVFSFFAVYFLVLAKKGKKKKVRGVKVKKKNLFFKGMLISALNVLPIAYFCGLNAAWNVSGWIKFEVTDVVTFIVAAGVGTFAMLYMYVFYFDKLQEKTDRFARYSDYILSALMGVLLIITLIRLFYAES
ncbi:LysE family transporter [Robertkochia aurantiaca]|uniref:LysE family transporter n=1 Tax=Robertkochia aurantiaca TaxID=2873700 RepID=UPI001CCAFFEB|nr:LysE family transporter [Robertkochia sp. 3YJGBD-33]